MEFLDKVIKTLQGDKGGSKEFWVDDIRCKVCFCCEVPFNVFVRKHHCRICGRIFCGNCTKNAIPPPRESTDQNWLRVCDYCYHVRQRGDQGTARVQQATPRSLGVGMLAPSNSFRYPLHPSNDPLMASGALDDSAASSSLPSTTGTASPQLSRTTTVRWSRSQSGTWGSAGAGSSAGSVVSHHRVTPGDLSWKLPEPLEDDYGMSLADRDARLLFQQQLEAGAGTLPPGMPPQAHSLNEVHRQLFSAASEAHLRAVVSQLLSAEGVPPAEGAVWGPIVAEAAQQVAAYLSPAMMYAGGSPDPRQVVKVKKVPHVGCPHGTAVITGVVVRKGLAHRKMRSYIEYPKVLLLAGSLEYQRETNKLSSFETLDHDKQYLANAVARLAVVKPDVVLVERSVARMAQEDLLARNISLGLGIKYELLERLARCMGVRVTPTVEHLSPATAHMYLGDCKVFRVESLDLNMPPPPQPPQQPPQAAAAAMPPPQPAAAADVGQGAASAQGSSTPLAGQRQRANGSDSGGAQLLPGSGVSAAPLLDHSPPMTGVRYPSPPPGQRARPPTPPRPAPLERQLSGFTSLSAAMMIKHLGTGPNAAAAAACTSAGASAAAVVSAGGFGSSGGGAGGFGNSVPVHPVGATGPPGHGMPAQRTSGTGTGTGTAAPGVAGAAAGPQHVASGAPGRPAPPPAAAPAPPQVTLMYFEGCRPMAATVLLKGAGRTPLVRLKRIMSFAVLTAWNARLESAFLADELTAAVVAAGEEALPTASGAAGAACPGLGPASALQAPGSPTHGQGPPPPQPSTAVTPCSPSLTFFRHQAEQIITSSILAASANGPPVRMLLSISPHANVWDAGVVQAWRQLGFTFPQHQDQQQQHQQQQQQSPSSQQQQQQSRALPPGGLSGELRGASRLGRQNSGVAAAEYGTVFASPKQGTSPMLPPSASLPRAEIPSSPHRGLQAMGSSPLAARSSFDRVAGHGGGAVGEEHRGLPGRLQLLEQSRRMSMSSLEPRLSAPMAPAQPLPPQPAATPLSAAHTGSVFASASAQQAAAAGSGGGAPVQGGPAGAAGPSPMTFRSAFAANAAAQWVGSGSEGGASAAGSAGPGAASAALVSIGDAIGAAGPGGAVEGPATPRIHDDGVMGGDEGVDGGGEGELPGWAGWERKQEREWQEREQLELEQQQRQQRMLVAAWGQRMYDYQRIFVSAAFRRCRDRNLCGPYETKQIDYYARISDVPLLRFIKMASTATWTCPDTAGCNETFYAHESVFLYGNYKLTIFYSTIQATGIQTMQALPGEEKNQVWHWTRPFGRGREHSGCSRRVPLSPDAAYLSMGKFLELSFAADGLKPFGRSLHLDHVRYFGLGRTLVCMLPERCNVYDMQLPDLVLSYSCRAQSKWFAQEAAELRQEVEYTYMVLEECLRESPYFAGASGPRDQPDAYPSAAAEASASGSYGTLGTSPGAQPGGGLAAGSGASGIGVQGTALASALALARQERTALLEAISECAVRNMPQEEQQQQQQADEVPGSWCWDEQLMAGVRELNSLRRHLGVNVLRWSGKLQDLPGFNRAHSAGGVYPVAGRPVHHGHPPGHQVLPPPPQGATPNPFAANQHIAAQAIQDAAGAAAGMDGGSAPRDAQVPLAISTEHSMSLFGATTSAQAAVSLGLMGHPPSQLQQQHTDRASAGGAPPGEGGGAGGESGGGAGAEQASGHPLEPAPHALPIPIVPHAGGPLAVAAIAEIVAQQEQRRSSLSLALSMSTSSGGQHADPHRQHARSAHGEALVGSAGSVGAVARMRTSSGGSLAQHTASGGGIGGVGSYGSMAGGSGERPGSAGKGRLGMLYRSSSRKHPDLGAGTPPLPPGTGAVTADGGYAGGEAAGSVGGGSGGGGGGGMSRTAYLSGGSLRRLSLMGNMASSAVERVGSGRMSMGGNVSLGGNLGAGGLGGGQLLRSASNSTLGDMADGAYSVGGVDSGAEDNDEDDGRHSDLDHDNDNDRDDVDSGSEEEEGDHDTFLAYMASSSHSGGGGGPAGQGQGAAGQAGPAGQRSGGGGMQQLLGRSTSRRGIRGAGGAGMEEDEELGDGAVYYRSLFGSTAGAQGDGASAGHPQLPPLQVSQPQLIGQGQGQAHLARVPSSSLGTLAAGSSPTAAYAQGMSPLGPGRRASVEASQPALHFPGAAAAAAAAAAAHAASGHDAAGALAASVGSRRALLQSMTRKIVALAGPSGGNLVRNLPQPGRPLLPAGVNDTVVPIYDGEPTSIIAYALSTRSYMQELTASYKAIFQKARAEAAGQAAAAPPGHSLARDAPYHPGPGMPIPMPMPPSQGQSLPPQAPLPQGPPPQALPQSIPHSAPHQQHSSPSAPLPTSAAQGVPSHSAPAGPHHPMSASAPGPGPSGPGHSQPIPNGPAPKPEWNAILTSRDPIHVRIPFEDKSPGWPMLRARFSVTAYFAPQFAELRRRCIAGGEAAFVTSLMRCRRWESRGGKSNAYFAKTRDDRYIVKSLSKSEKASFMSFAPHYFNYMSGRLRAATAAAAGGGPGRPAGAPGGTPGTCLAKVLGVFTVACKPQPGPGGGGAGGEGAGGGAGLAAKDLKDKEFSMDLLVMENCFYDRPVWRIYDLKGSERNRFNEQAHSRPDDSLEVHLDDNLRRHNKMSPLFVEARSRAAMEAALWADTAFLAQQDVMDYSLLVGVDRENGVLALAIIDFIRQYTWDKQLETWVKSSGMLGGNGKEPTIVSPKQYMRRFRAAMQTYFTAVPGAAGAEPPLDPDAST